MPKGQRSNKEAKKPKKEAPSKLPPAVGLGATRPLPAASPPKKR